MSNHTQNLTRLPSNPQYYNATTDLTPQRLGDSQTELLGFNDPRSVSNTDLMYVHAPESWNSISVNGVSQIKSKNANNVNKLKNT
ncbi:hypothetical protein HBI24_171550 [Parastagonospora nodorum]|nr:hypothetical protein HBH46_231440 [Parastagonospora nodorum]KAH5507191.1 hypothetical protein HBI52_144450 [Parastagonospora nodorum]KAH5577433.1 hypothetical protein HBI24_171550 [Parastagonospora nodorum]KAH5616643.1 hypothetical protein HBI45_000780 [Parastagonospora nodorum]